MCLLSKDDYLQALQRGKLVEMGEKSRNSITTGIRGFTFLHRDGIFKLSRSPGIDSNKSYPPACVALAGRYDNHIFLLGSLHSYRGYFQFKLLLVYQFGWWDTFNEVKPYHLI
jgi:hypothetical protein